MSVFPRCVCCILYISLWSDAIFVHCAFNSVRLSVQLQLLLATTLCVCVRVFAIRLLFSINGSCAQLGYRSSTLNAHARTLFVNSTLIHSVLLMRRFDPESESFSTGNPATFAFEPMDAHVLE